MGRKLCIGEVHETELQNRLALGWAAFHKHKAELCSPAYKLEDRIRLFIATVSPVVLYGASTSVLLKDMERRLHTAWRRMLRYVFRLHRRRAPEGEDGEDWVECLKRTARHVEDLAQAHGLESWTHTYRRLKWRLAGKLARTNDNRWSKVILSWKPWEESGRGLGRPKTRWTDQIEKYAGGNWQDTALDTSHWEILEEGFATIA